MLDSLLRIKERMSIIRLLPFEVFLELGSGKNFSKRVTELLRKFIRTNSICLFNQQAQPSLQFGSELSQISI